MIVRIRLAKSMAMSRPKKFPVSAERDPAAGVERTIAQRSCSRSPPSQAVDRRLRFQLAQASNGLEQRRVLPPCRLVVGRDGCRVLGDQLIAPAEPEPLELDGGLDLA